MLARGQQDDTTSANRGIKRKARRKVIKVSYPQVMMVSLLGEWAVYT